MGVYEARGQLGKGLKDLLLRWNEARFSWDDAQSRQFQEKFIEPMEAELKDAVAAMDHMAVLLGQIRRDCE